MAYRTLQNSHQLWLGVGREEGWLVFFQGASESRVSRNLRLSITAHLPDTFHTPAGGVRMSLSVQQASAVKEKSISLPSVMALTALRHFHMLTLKFNAIARPPASRELFEQPY
ncbi:hypothetical protein Bbelb_423230 [Branchiostoma belcheri]|nr:hypothetical protein Bbelb_423230 [Branchiostoma belcheri]